MARIHQDFRQNFIRLPLDVVQTIIVVKIREQNFTFSGPRNEADSRAKSVSAPKSNIVAMPTPISFE